MYKGDNSLILATSVFMLTIILTFGCAVVKPPSGGPEDKIPPEISSIFPAPDSAGVSKDITIIIDFSEEIDASTFKKKIALYPQVEIKKIRAKGSKLLIEFAEELPETTFCLVIKPGYKDYHGVESKRPYLFYFSTSDSLEQGSISGRVFFKRKPDSTAVVKLYSVAADTAIDFIKERESRMVFAGFDGGYIFKAIPSDSSKFILFAFIDKNRNGNFEKDKEFSASFKDTIILTQNSRSYHGADIYIIDPNEPGKVIGSVINKTPIELTPSVILFPVMPKEKPLYTTVGEGGIFRFEKVKPGAYILTALLDIEADSLCGKYRNPADTSQVLEEPCVSLPDTLIVNPGETKEIEQPLILNSEER